MTMREVGGLRTIQTVVEGVPLTWQAAERLQLSRHALPQGDRPGNRKLLE